MEQHTECILSSIQMEGKRLRGTLPWMTLNVWIVLPFSHNHHVILAEEEEICWMRPKSHPLQSWLRQREWAQVADGVGA